jgi:hypothetical protein
MLFDPAAFFQKRAAEFLDCETPRYPPWLRRRPNSALATHKETRTQDK